MTTKTDTEYAEELGERCPFCDSIDIEGYEWKYINSMGAIASQRVECNNCERQWRDKYELTGYEPMES